MIYEGAPSHYLPALAATIRDKLADNHRCLYLNSQPMVAGMRSYLSACGVDVAACVRKGSLVLSSSHDHLLDGEFDGDRMLGLLVDAVEQASKDGYKGLWATGDMSWQFGPRGDFRQLLDYEMKLEKYFRTEARLSGVCQYHADTLPSDVMKKAEILHQSVFISATLSRVNPSYLPPEKLEELFKSA